MELRLRKEKEIRDKKDNEQREYQVIMQENMRKVD